VSVNNSRIAVRLVAVIGLCDISACLDSSRTGISSQESQVDEVVESIETTATGGEGTPASSALAAIERLVEQWTPPQQQWLVWNNDEALARQVFLNPPPTTPDPNDIVTVQQQVDALSPADERKLLLWTARHSR
jgi:hypothetical protein